MPGKGGMVPDQNSFSVPVEIPECATSTTTSAADGSVRPNSPTDRFFGPDKMTALVFTVAPWGVRNVSG
jgi:hypothetical protein